MPGSSNNAGEHGTWRIVSGETGLAHAGAIVHYQSGYLVVTHGVSLLIKFHTGKIKVSGMGPSLSVLSQATGNGHRGNTAFIQAVVNFLENLCFSPV
jgi:hypothetical protein